MYCWCASVTYSEILADIQIMLIPLSVYIQNFARELSSCVAFNNCDVHHPVYAARLGRVGNESQILHVTSQRLITHRRFSELRMTNKLPRE